MIMIPYELIHHITNFNPIHLNMNVFLSNKYFYEYFLNTYMDKIKFLKKKYRKYRLPQTFIYPREFLPYHNWYHWQYVFGRNNKLRIYRYFIGKISDAFIIGYPEYILRRISPYENSRYLIIKDWVDKNLPKDLRHRNRKHVWDFFVENRITFAEILKCGI